MTVRNEAIARPWAKALYEVAEAQKATDKVTRDLESLAALVNESEDLRRFFANPIISEEDRLKVVSALADKLSASKVTKNFLQLLAEKRRLSALIDIVRAFRARADRAAGLVRAEAWAPVKLSPVQISRLKGALEEMLGQKVEVEGAVDASLMGGLVVKVEGRVYDNSVKTQLAAMRQNVLRI